MRAGSVVVILAAAVTACGVVRAQDEDLAVVKKAVATGEKAKETAIAAAKTGGAKARWLKVLVNERTGKRVVVNLPLSLVRALGDDWPAEWGCRFAGWPHPRCALKASQMLASLEAGQTLVEVNGEGDTVRVWVE